MLSGLISIARATASLGGRDPPRANSIRLRPVLGVLSDTSPAPPPHPTPTLGQSPRSSVRPTQHAFGHDPTRPNACRAAPLTLHRKSKRHSTAPTWLLCCCVARHQLSCHACFASDGRRCSSQTISLGKPRVGTRQAASDPWSQARRKAPHSQDAKISTRLSLEAISSTDPEHSASRQPQTNAEHIIAS